MKPLRIALTKGRLEKDTVNLLEQIGLDCTQVREKGRRLILPVGNGEIEVVLAKAADVITYVENGVCDLGVVGKDTIMENGSHFYEILDLGFGSPAARVRISSAATKRRPSRPNTRTSHGSSLKAAPWTCASSKSRAP